jgi:dynein heavy chain
MDSKRIAFPRFFFVSPSDLLDILSSGGTPEKVMKHMPKIISACDTLELIKEGVRPFVKGLHSCVGKEYVEFTRELKLLGKVECYMQDILDCMKGSLKDIMLRAIKKFGEMDKYEWIVGEPSMTCLLINNCNWVISCEAAFGKM